MWILLVNDESCLFPNHQLIPLLGIRTIISSVSYSPHTFANNKNGNDKLS